jgi:hypothetical protein
MNLKRDECNAGEAVPAFVEMLLHVSSNNLSLVIKNPWQTGISQGFFALYKQVDF